MSRTCRRRVLVSGTVQGVFYRASCRDEARRAAVAGWARNLADGRVEAVFEGSPAAVDALVDWCRHGPPAARVTDIEVLDEVPRGETGFHVS